MSFIHSPKIVTEQLSLLLDVSNPKSYPAGSAWVDLAYRRSLNSSGTPPTLENVSGAYGLTANGSGYWSGSVSADFGGECTLLMWIYAKVPDVRRTVFEKAGTVYNSYEQEIAVTWETANNFTWYSRYNTYDTAATATMIANQWNLVGIKMSTGKTTSPRTGFYSMNGAPWVANYTSRSSASIVPAGDVKILSGYAGTIATGSVGMIIGYNKMLTDDEVLQNFNATRTRFGV